MRITRLVVAFALVFPGCRDLGLTGPDLRNEKTPPKLAVCPTSETLTNTFVASPLLGGSLTLAGTTVTVPAGAVSLPTSFVVTIPASQFMEIEVHALGLDSFIFATPATITIDYSRCSTSNVDTEPLSAWHIDVTTKELLEDMGGSDDKLLNRFTFSTGHLSGYALAY